MDGLNGDALSNIYTHIASQLSGTMINGSEFNINDLDGKKIHSGPSVSGDSSWETYGRIFGNRGWNDKIVGNNNYKYESTVENLQASIVYHEWWGHIANPFSSKKEYNNHSEAYKAVMNSPLWGDTTLNYQNFVKRMYNYYKNYESKKNTK